MAAKSKTISRTLFFPLLTVVLLLIFVFVIAIVSSGAISEAYNSSVNVMQEKVKYRAQNLREEMLIKWAEMDDFEYSVSSVTSSFLKKHHMSSEDLTIGSALTADLLSEFEKPISDVIKNNGVNGAFVIFDGNPDAAEKAAINLVDTSNGKAKSTLSVKIGSDRLSYEVGLGDNPNRTPSFSLNNSGTEKLYLMPYRAAIDNPALSMSELGYWTALSGINENSDCIITYSCPLIISGKVVGVIGVDINLENFDFFFPSSSLSPNDDSAFMLLSSADGAARNLYMNNPSIILPSAENGLAYTSEEKSSSFYKMTYENELVDSLYFYNVSLDLYSANSPFVGDDWIYSGIISSPSLLHSYNNMLTATIVAVIISLFIGVFGLLTATWFISRPVEKIGEEIKSLTSEENFSLPKTNISEIDELLFATENLSLKVKDSNLQLSKVLSMTDSLIAAFEYNLDTKAFFHTDLLGVLLDYTETDDEDKFASFNRRLSYLDKNCLEGGTAGSDVKTYRFFNNQKRLLSWVNVKTSTDGNRFLGVVIDVTKEVLDRRKTEYQRDYDTLTGLLNRKAFLTEMKNLMSGEEELKVAAMLMLDLDNLKYVNDELGHDEGDNYIIHVANSIKRSVPSDAICSRISGDEFYVFFYGYNSKEEIMTSVEAIWDCFDKPQTHDIGIKYSTHASGGIAWYPDDGNTYDTLMKYADFAMYTSKNSSKGRFSEFNRDEYKKNAFLTIGKSELDSILEEGRIKYYFQPIVDTSTGEVFAYEALMRPQSDILKSPGEVLKVAKQQSQLYSIERLTMFRAMSAFIELDGESTRNTKIFINSISNQVFNNDDNLMFSSAFSNYLNRLVVEITEEENMDSIASVAKNTTLHSWNSQIALDDFGTGYNGEAMLLNLSPDYIKVDQSIVRNIASDENRQVILQNLIFYARRQDIKIIAEGVETKEELDFLIKNGIDLLQGFYLGRPNPELIAPPPEVKAQIIKAATKYGLT